MEMREAADKNVEGVIDETLMPAPRTLNVANEKIEFARIANGFFALDRPWAITPIPFSSRREISFRQRDSR